MKTTDFNQSSGEGEGSSPPLLLIDIKNALYRVAYASKSLDEGVLILMRHLGDWIKRFSPRQIVAAWDAPRNEVWRRDVSPSYKNRDGSRYIEDYGSRIIDMIPIVRNLFEDLGVVNLSKDRMEADDLIYACASMVNPQRCVIVSSDSDMAQIPHTLGNVSVYNAQDGNFMVPTSIMVKALAGDKSDSVDGYPGIGKVKANRIIAEHDYRKRFFDEHGWDTLQESLLLVDLSCCPFLLENKIYCLKELTKARSVNMKMVSQTIVKHKLKMVYVEQQRLLGPFRVMASCT
jgi:5'-3' exonuclease